MAEEKRLYVRKASGLIRAIGIFGATVFGVHCISLSSSGFIPFSWVASVWPGSSIIGLLTVAMILCLFHAYTYAMIGSSMPRSGADYVVASRVLNPLWAFMSSWTLVIFSGMVAGALIAWIPDGVLPTLLQSMGIIFDIPTFLAWAKWIHSPIGIFVLGTFFVIITWYTMIQPARTVIRILAIGFWLGILAWLIIYFCLLTPVGTFEEQWNKFMVPTVGEEGRYDNRILLAEEAGMVYNPNMLIMTLAGLLMGFWIYYGYYIPTFFAGEVKEAPRTLLIGSWASLIITWLIFGLGDILLERLVPLKWIAAEGYLLNNTEIFAMPWITFYAAIMRPNFLLALIVAIGWTYTLVNLAQTYFFYSSRIVFAWAFDRLIPEKVADVHPKLHSPVVAISIIAVLAEIGVIDAAFLRGVLGAQLNFVFFAVCCQLAATVAMTIFPFLKPDLFEACPAIVKKRVGRVPVVTIVGAITVAYQLWMIIASFLFPAVGGRIGAGTLITLFSFFALGAIVYYVARWYRMKTEGIDLAWTFKAIPPV